MASAGRRGRHVLRLAGASDWRRATLDVVASAIIGATGTRVLPRADGDASAWPWPAVETGELEATLAEHIAGIQLLGGIVPRQPGRQRLSLLATTRHPDRLLVVKLGAPDTGIEREAAALRLLERDPLPCIRTPQVMVDGSAELVEVDDATVSAVAFIVTSATDLSRQAAAIDEPLRTYEHDLGQRLSSLERPHGTPAEHVPVHGDLTPWNLRRTPRGLALFDWEDAGWGPPGSDVSSYRAACATLPRRRRPAN